MTTAYLLRKEDTPLVGSDTKGENSVEVTPERGLFCRACSHLITRESFAIAVNGDHLHTFFNPSGIIYEIGCFKKAEGCVLHGPPSFEFSWFAGHAWQIATCMTCFDHLGWFFSGAETHFFGLIRKNLKS